MDGDILPFTMRETIPLNSFRMGNQTASAAPPPTTLPFPPIKRFIFDIHSLLDGEHSYIIDFISLPPPSSSSSSEEEDAAFRSSMVTFLSFPLPFGFFCPPPQKRFYCYYVKYKVSLAIVLLLSTLPP